MIWNFNKIPKILHCYWDMSPMSFLRFMTVCSFKKLNPEWEIYVHYPIRKYEGKATWPTPELKDINVTVCHLKELMRLDYIKFIEHDFVSLGFKNDVPENFKSDFIRYYVLNKYGGVWSDFDILYFKPITDLLENTPDNSEKEFFIFKYLTIHGVSFILSKPDNPYLYRLLCVSVRKFNITRYQSMGTAIWTEDYLSLNYIIGNKDCVYQYDCEHVRQLFSENNTFNENAIGCHWFGGHPLSQQYESKMQKHNYKEFNNTISKIICL